MIVKVTIEGSTAHIRSQDKKLDIRVPASQVVKRMPGQTEAFFTAEDDRATASLEIGERMPDQAW